MGSPFPNQQPHPPRTSTRTSPARTAAPLAAPSLQHTEAPASTVAPQPAPFPRSPTRGPSPNLMTPLTVRTGHRARSCTPQGQRASSTGARSPGTTPPPPPPANAPDVARGNPLDMVFDVLRAAAPRPGALVPLQYVEHRMSQLGMSRAMLTEALENWESLGTLDWPGRGCEVGLTEEAWRTQSCHLAPPPGALAPPHGPSHSAGAGRRPIALISLFDGL